VGKGHRRLRPARSVVLAAALAGGLLLANACSSAVSSSTAKQAAASGPVTSDLSFYKGKTITLIAPDKAGGGFDTSARWLAQWMGQYLHATIKVTDIPAGNGIEAMNTTGSATPDGLTFGVFNLTVAFEDEIQAQDPTGRKAGITTDLSKLSWLVGTSNEPGVYVVPTSSPYHSIEDVLNSTSPVKVLEVTSGTAKLQVSAFVQGYGFDNQVITGYESSTDVLAGILRGDGDFTSVELNHAAASIKEGKLRALAATVPVDPKDSNYGLIKDLPTLAQVFVNNPPTSAQQRNLVSDFLTFSKLITGVAAPAGVPAARLAALEAAALWAVHQPGAIAQALKESINPTWVGPAQIDAYIKTAYSAGLPIASWLK
jgi:tripartite-type tricarboxylate transporter receptor subunit TctC